MSDAQLLRALATAAKKMNAASLRRRSLPAGSSRARITTANARWATACEAHHRLWTEARQRGLEVP